MNLLVVYAAVTPVRWLYPSLSGSATYLQCMFPGTHPALLVQVFEAKLDMYARMT